MAWNAGVAGFAGAVQTLISKPYQWAYDPERINSLEKAAAAARDEFMGPKMVKIDGNYRTYIGAYDPWTGRVAAAHSGPEAPGGGCAEDAAACELGIPKNRAGFTKAYASRTDTATGERVWKPIDVCARNCQNNTFESQYPNDAKFEGGGAIDAGKIDTLEIGVTAAKWAGRGLLGLAVAGDVIDVATAPPGQRVKRAISDGVSLAGAIAGGEVGAEIGASAGSFFGPAGTVVGGIAGSGLASKAVSWATSLF